MRTLTAPALAALASNAVGMALLVEMELTSTLRLSSSSWTINYGGNDYLGAGLLGSVERVNDSPSEIKPLRFVISGVPTETIAIALAEPIRNRPCKLRLAILDSETHAVLDAPIVWSGTLDQMPITHQTDESGRSTCTIAATAEHRGATFGRVKPLRYTNGDQRKLFPTDTSLRFIPVQVAHKDIWPASSFGRQ